MGESKRCRSYIQRSLGGDGMCTLDNGHIGTCKSSNGLRWIKSAKATIGESNIARANEEVIQLRSQIETLKSDAVVLAGAVDVATNCATCSHYGRKLSSEPCHSCVDFEYHRPSQAVKIALKYRGEG